MQLKIYIAHKDIPIKSKKSLFILTRPFLKDSNWQSISTEKFQYEIDINKAAIVLLPFSINYYFESNQSHLLTEINSICIQNKIKAFGYVGGDFGVKFPEFSNIIYFRQGGFKSQLSENNTGFIVGLSDHFQRLYQQENIKPALKKEVPVIGFCGHASHSILKKRKEQLKFIVENAKRFTRNPLNAIYEPLFASAYERAKLLDSLMRSDGVKTNFIFRENYRGGAISEAERTKTTLEYYDNILSSDYVLCVRGAGNFSVRFYETLMMGKIPIFVNTDCLLPFENQIDWRKHVVWIEWNERKDIAQLVADFHNRLSDDEFVHLQINNRKLWKETLSVAGILEMISNDI